MVILIRCAEHHPLHKGAWGAPAPVPQTKARPGRNPGRAVLLAIWRKVCYAVYGATSTTVGGSPRFYGGDTSLPPIAREGVMVMVTWEGLFQFCMVIATVIALVIQAYNDKK